MAVVIFTRLKARDGKKAELKVRTRTGQHGLEAFVKYKLGKGDLSLYASEVSKKLRNHGVCLPDDEAYVNRGRKIQLRKERVKTNKHGLAFEVCKVYIESCSGDIDPQILDRKYFSISVEEYQSTDILQGISEIYPDNHVIWSILKFLVNHCDIIPLYHSHTPFIGGYPGFISFVSGNSTEAERKLNTQVCLDLIASFSTRVP